MLPAHFWVLFCLNSNGGPRYVVPENHERHPTRVNGCVDYECSVRRHVKVADSQIIKVSAADGGKVVVNFHHFLPGSVVAVKVKLAPTAQLAVAQLRSFITGKPGSSVQWDELLRVLEPMSLADMNMALYRCNEEEVEDGRPACYNIPGFGSFVYCGLQGVMSVTS